MCALATVAATVALSAPSAAAAPALSLSASAVERGGTIDVTAPGCETDPMTGPLEDSYTYRNAEVVLITGTGAGERLASYGFANEDDGKYQLSVPGWVDPAEPAVVAGWCTERSFDGTTTAPRRLFSYPESPST